MRNKKGSTYKKYYLFIWRRKRDFSSWILRNNESKPFVYVSQNSSVTEKCFTTNMKKLIEGYILQAKWVWASPWWASSPMTSARLAHPICIATQYKGGWESSRTKPYKRKNTICVVFFLLWRRLRDSILARTARSVFLGRGRPPEVRSTPIPLRIPS